MVDTAPGNDRTGVAAAADLTPDQRTRLSLYLTELDRWNRRLNLTSVPRAAAWQRHVGESMTLAHPAGLASGARVIDVGTGAGVPGIVLAVLRPDLAIALLESDRRKCAFLTHVAGLLALGSMVVINERAESAGHDPGLRELFDVAVSRAAARAPVLCELALPFVRVGGRLTALVADARVAARECQGAARALGGATPEALDGLLTITKIAPTPVAFPRRPGVPARRPLGR